MNLLEIKFLGIDEGMIWFTDIGQNHKKCGYGHQTLLL